MPTPKNPPDRFGHAPLSKPNTASVSTRTDASDSVNASVQAYASDPAYASDSENTSGTTYESVPASVPTRESVSSQAYVPKLPLSDATRLLLDAFQLQDENGYTTASSRKAEHSASGQIISLYPTLHAEAGYRARPALSFQIGKPDGWHVLKDITVFVRHVRLGHRLEIGRRFHFSPGIHLFDPLSGQLLQLMLDAHRDLAFMFGDSAGMNRHFGNKDARFLFLSPTHLNRFLDIMEKAGSGDGRAFEMEWTLEREMLRVRSGSFHIPLSIDTVPGGFRVTSEIDVTTVGTLSDDHSLLVSDGILYRLDAESAKKAKALLLALGRTSSAELLVPDSAAPILFHDILPVFDPDHAVKLPEHIEDTLFRAPVSTKLFLDREWDKITARPEWWYGETCVPEENQRQAIRTVDGRLVLRNREEEALIENRLQQLGFTREHGIWQLEGEDNLFEFMTEGLPLLFDLAEISATPAFTGLTVRKGTKVSASLGFAENNLLSFAFQPEGMSREELLLLLAAYRNKRKYVRLQNGDFLRVAESGAAQVASVLDQLAMRDSALSRETLEVPVYRAPTLDRLSREEGFHLSRSAPIRTFVRDITAPEEIPFNMPDGLNAVLREYQKTGISWMSALTRNGCGGILADDMGLGKTIQVLTLLLQEKQAAGLAGMAALPSLVIAPTSLVLNWQEEANRFTPALKVLVVSGQAEERVLLREDIAGADVVITSYALVRRDQEAYRDIRFRFCIADEAQYIKNPNSVSAKSVRRIKADTRFALTGTPVENSLTELWSLFDFVMPGYLHAHHHFIVKYEAPISRHGNKQSLKELTRHIAPFILRRMKKDVLKELPEKIEMQLCCDMTEGQKKLYAAHLLHARKEVQQTLDKAGIQKSRIKILALLTRLRQICCHPGVFLEGYRGGSGKMNLLMEVVEEALAGSHRILLFSQFTQMLGLIREMLDKKQISCLYLDGSTPAGKRQELVKSFNAGMGGIFLISLKAGGSGLNLTGADTVIHFDPWWNPAVEDQATDRAYRMGQKNAVQVIRLVTAGTIEEKIDLLHKRKRDLTDQVILPGETFLNNLSEGDIQSLFG